MRFLIDMPLSPGLATWLRERGHEADHASAVGLHNAKDQRIIEVAREQNRIIVTADLDYPQLLAVSRAKDPGVFCSEAETTMSKRCCGFWNEFLNALPKRSFAILLRL